MTAAELTDRLEADIRRIEAETTRDRQKERMENIATMTMMLERMLEWGYTQAEIARRAGISTSTIWQWRVSQNRRFIKRETVDKVMTAFLGIVEERRAAA